MGTPSMRLRSQKWSRFKIEPKKTIRVEPGIQINKIFSPLHGPSGGPSGGPGGFPGSYYSTSISKKLLPIVKRA